MSAETLLVWDREAEPADAAALRWRHFGGDSIPAYVEANAERLRDEYLKFIHAFSLTEVAGKSIADHLDAGDGFSMWWMTRLAEKSPFKSPGIYSAIRLLALADIVRARKTARVAIDTGDDDLAEAIFALCESMGVACERRPGPENARSWRRWVPPPLKGAFAFARHLVTRWPMSRGPRPHWSSDGKAVFFCSFALGNNPVSRYWGVLPERLLAAGRPMNWIHHFLPEQTSATTNWGPGAHAFLDAYLSVRVVIRAFRRWLWLNVVSWRLRTPPVGWLWPVHREDWRMSLAGPVGALNCLWLELFDAGLSDMPRQGTGLYLCENQAWEPALIRAWRKHGHGEIIGVAHATVPFWHLYYLDYLLAAHARPSPDRFAVNGSAATRILSEAKMPMDRVVEVEALRYLGLPASPRSATAGYRVLILGDVLPESMRALLTNLERAAKLLPPEYRFTLKPHPLFAAEFVDRLDLRIERTNEELGKILGEYDVALAANSTSAAVDAHLAGLPVIVGLDGADLNLSPLRAEPGVRFVATPADLARALRAAVSAGGDRMFHLEKDLPRWRRLLKLGAIE